MKDQRLTVEVKDDELIIRQSQVSEMGHTRAQRAKGESVSPTETITVKYSCLGCGLHRITVQVPARGDESVTTWMKQTLSVSISIDHSARSPRCISRTMSEVMIPIAGADKVGGTAIQ